jgi:hypothetical protein
MRHEPQEPSPFGARFENEVQLAVLEIPNAPMHEP